MLLVVFALIPAAGARASGDTATGPASAARRYIEAVLNHDGKSLCPLLDAATRRTVDQVIEEAKTDPTFRVPADCAHVTTLLIGYPHENMGYRFTGGKLLSVGGSRTVTVGAHQYIGIDVRVSLRTEANGSYALVGKPAPSPTLTDTVWLVRLAHGWRTAKPSLTLLVALNGEILSDDPRQQTYKRQGVLPPTH